MFRNEQQETGTYKKLGNVAARNNAFATRLVVTEKPAKKVLLITIAILFLKKLNKRTKEKEKTCSSEQLFTSKYSRKIDRLSFFFASCTFKTL